MDAAHFSERTAPNSVIASLRAGGHLSVKSYQRQIWVTGTARYVHGNNFIRDFFTYFRIGNSGVVVIMDTFPVQGLRLLPSGFQQQSNVTN